MDRYPKYFILCGFAGYNSAPREVCLSLKRALGDAGGPAGNAKALMRAILLNAFIDGWIKYQLHSGAELVYLSGSEVNAPWNLYSWVDDRLVAFMGEPYSNLDVPNRRRFIKEARSKGLVIKRMCPEIEGRLLGEQKVHADDKSQEMLPAMLSTGSPFFNGDGGEGKDLFGFDVGSYFSGPDELKEAILEALWVQLKENSDRLEDSFDLCHSRGWLKYIRRHPKKRIVFAPAYGNLWTLIDGKPVCLAGELFSKLRARPPLSVIDEVRCKGIPVVERGQEYVRIIRAVKRLKKETTTTREPRLHRQGSYLAVPLDDDESEQRDPKPENVAPG